MSKDALLSRCSILASAIALAGLALPARARDLSQLPLDADLYPFVRWSKFSRHNSWAGGEQSAELKSITDWGRKAEEVDAEVDRAPHVLRMAFPDRVPPAGEPTNCVGSAIRKMALLVNDHGFPSGDARLMYLKRLP